MRRKLTIALAAAGSLLGCSRAVERLYVQQLESPSYSNPLVTKDLVIFGSEGGGVYAYSKDGTRRWNYNPSLREVYSAPAWDGSNLAFFGATNQNVYAVNITTGERKWTFKSHDRIKGDPTYWNGLVIIGSYDQHLYALDAETGLPRWVFPQARPPPAPTPPPAPETAAAKAQPVPAAAVQQPPAQPPIEVGAFSYSKPLVVNNVLYVGNLDGYMYALDAATGELRWRFKTGKGTESSGIGVTSSPAYNRGVLYFGSNDHFVYAVAEDGIQVRWRFDTGEPVLASPLVDDGVVYIGSMNKTLYALDETTGAVRWTFKGQGPFVSTPALHGNHIVQCGGAGDGTINLLAKADGKVVWSHKTGYKIESDPTVVGDALFVTAGDARLYAFQINAK